MSCSIGNGIIPDDYFAAKQVAVISCRLYIQQINDPPNSFAILPKIKVSVFLTLFIIFAFTSA